MYKVELKNNNGKYSVNLILWDKNGYGSAFGKYLGRSYKKARITAEYIAKLYNCEIKEENKWITLIL